MHTIAFVTQKGGSGKTTLALTCAVLAQQPQQQALIIDMDPQGSAENWYQIREAPTPKLIQLASPDLPQALATAQQAGFGWAFIDTPGRNEPVVAAAIRAADLCVIPCRPTAADMKATPQTVHTIQRLGKPLVFVLNQTPPRGYRIREARQGLSVLGMVAPVPLVMRNAYQDAFSAGLGVTELEPEGKAATETQALWAWLERKLEKLDHGQEAYLTGHTGP